MRFPDFRGFFPGFPADLLPALNRQFRREKEDDMDHLLPARGASGRGFRLRHHLNNDKRPHLEMVVLFHDLHVWAADSAFYLFPLEADDAARK